MSRKCCSDCGTRIELNGVCPNCDEAAFIMDWQSDCLPGDISPEFERQALDGYKRAAERVQKTKGEQ